MRLAINVAAVLIAFLALVAMIDHGLGLIRPGLSLAGIFAIVFAPVAALIGVPAADVPLVADLLGTKLVATEFVAYLRLTGDYAGIISERGHVLATYALTGFANLGSIGILLGGIGGMAPERRGDPRPPGVPGTARRFRGNPDQRLDRGHPDLSLLRI